MLFLFWLSLIISVDISIEKYSTSITNKWRVLTLEGNATFNAEKYFVNRKN